MPINSKTTYFGKAQIGAIILIALALLFGFAFSLATGGRSDIGWHTIWQFFTGNSQNELAIDTLRNIRLPRASVAALLGINLALSGLILQAVTRNPLASPSILGINQGAALGLVAALAFPQATGLSLDAMAIVGALTAGTLAFAIAGGFKGRIDSLKLVLGGVAVGAFAYSAVRFAYTLEDDLARSVVRWTIGDIGNVRWNDAKMLTIWGLGGVIATYLLSHRLNMMSLGDASAKGLGADPRWTLLLGAVIAAALAGVCVVAAGPIGFVGLVIPHISRAIFGGDHRILVPTSALAGAALMVFSDAISKVIPAPTEVPIGLIAALIGAPYFLYLALFAEGVE